MSYKNLEIWKLSRDLFIQIHEMSFKLPRIEQYEEAQQIRRSAKTVKSTIVEGYGQRRYKVDFTKFLIYALSTNEEKIDHLETLFETKSLTDQLIFDELHLKLGQLDKKINNFIQAVERSHNEFQT